MSNIFSEPCGDGLLQVMPITVENIEEACKAKDRISDESWELYVSGNQQLVTLERVVQRPPLRPGDTGTVFFAMLLNGKIVGLSNHHYYESLWGGNYCVCGGLVVLDKYQRRGIGTAYSHISVRIAKYMGAKFFYGETRTNSPMHLMRKRQGWEILESFKRFGTDWIKIRLAL